MPEYIYCDDQESRGLESAKGHTQAGGRKQSATHTQTHGHTREGAKAHARQTDTQHDNVRSSNGGSAPNFFASFSAGRSHYSSSPGLAWCDKFFPNYSPIVCRLWLSFTVLPLYHFTTLHSHSHSHTHTKLELHKLPDMPIGQHLQLVLIYGIFSLALSFAYFSLALAIPIDQWPVPVLCALLASILRLKRLVVIA